MKAPREILRAAFVGMVALVVCGGLMASETKDGSGATRAAADLAAEAPERIRMIFGLGVAGAIVGAATWLLLRMVAPGPKTKVAVGPILGAFVATCTFGIGALKNGKVEDVAGVIVLAAIAGFFVALVDASRHGGRHPVEPAGGDRI
jgi:hypothetical protein